MKIILWIWYFAMWGLFIIAQIEKDIQGIIVCWILMLLAYLVIIKHDIKK